MTRSELFKLHELKGRLQGRGFCLENDIRYSEDLAKKLETSEYKARFTGRVEVLIDWAEYNTRLLTEVCQIIKEAENDRE